MYYFFGLKFGKEQRSINDPLNYQAQNPEHPSSNPNRWLLDIFNSRPTSSGVRVDPETAPAFSAVYRCVSLISSTMAIPPQRVYTLKDRWLIPDNEHDLNQLYREPSGIYTGYVWKELMMQFSLLWGNGYSKILRDKYYKPIGFKLLHSKDVRPFIGITKNGDEQIFYEHSWRDGQGKTHKDLIEPFNMFHIPCVGFDGIAGKSPVTVARENIGLGLAAEKFAGDFYKNNAAYSGIYTHPSEMSDEAYKRLKESIEDNARYGEKSKALLLEGGTDYKPVTMPLQDQQFIEQRRFQIEEIARMYGVPLHKLNHSGEPSGSTEQQAIEFVSDTMLPWFKKWEAESDRKLFTEADKRSHVSKHDLSELLRGDGVARSTKHKSLFAIGAISQNEVRAAEDMPPIENGDKYFIPLNMIDVNKVDDVVQQIGDNVPGQQDKKKPGEPGMGAGGDNTEE